MGGRAFAVRAVGSVLAWGAPAWAEAPPAYVLPPVEVPAPAPEPTPLPPESADRREPTAATTQVSASRRSGEAKTLGELLATTPGARVQSSGGFGQRQTLSLRGAPGHGAVVLLDGVPLSGAGGQVDLARVPLPLLERVEVVRGPAGARYGSGGMGGAVNLVTRSADPRGRAFGQLSTGSFSSWSAVAGGSGAALGGAALVLGHYGQARNDFAYRYDPLPALEGNPLETRRRVNNDARLGGGLLKYQRPMGRGGLSVLAEASAEARGLAGPVENPTADARQRTTHWAVSARASSEPRAEGTWEALAFFRGDAHRYRGGPFGAGAPYLDQYAGTEVTHSRLLGGAHGLAVTAALGAQWLRADSGPQPVWARWALMALDEWWLSDTWLLSPSVRVERNGPYTGVSPKLGAKWAFAPGFELRANAGQAYRAPSFLERYVPQGNLLPNPRLRPERALSADAQLRWQHASWTLAVGPFVALYEDLISYEYYPPSLARAYNFSAARVQGVELEARVHPTSWVEGQASYTFLDSLNLKDDPRYYLKPLPYRPAHTAHVRLEGGPRWLRGHVEALVLSEQFYNRAQTRKMAPRAMVDLGASLAVWPPLGATLSVELRNALDVAAQDLDGYPLPPRAAFLTLAVAYGNEGPTADPAVKGNGR